MGPIGGVRQKVLAAGASGAQYILVPAANYEEALTAGVRGPQIVAIETIGDALEFLEALPPAS